MPRCYRCGGPATSREHYPPKAFFPRRSGLQLKTVPSCDEHNNAKSADDQYLLAHIVMNASREGNLARDAFMEKVLPQVKKSSGYAAILLNGSRSLEDGSRAYKVDVARIDRVFDSICHATFFAHFNKPFDDSKHAMHHLYPDFFSDDSEYNKRNSEAKTQFSDFIEEYSPAITRHAQVVNDLPVYSYQLVAPAKDETSITILHNFYGMFNVISLLTRTWSDEIRSTLRDIASGRAK